MRMLQVLLINRGSLRMRLTIFLAMSLTISLIVGTRHRRGHIIIIVQGGGGLAEAVIHFDIEGARVIETWVGAHGVVGAETGLATANDHVQPDCGDVADQADDVKCEEGFVASADGDAR